MQTWSIWTVDLQNVGRGEDEASTDVVVADRDREADDESKETGEDGAVVEDRDADDE